MDNIIGGGVPKGRTIEIFGAESAGKTTLAYQMCAQHELCLDIPIEGCVDKDTEFFNGKEWKKISEYKKDENVLQYNKDGTASLVKPLKYHKKDACQMWRVKTKNRLDMVVSEYHNVVYRSIGNNEVKIKPFHDIHLRMLRNKEGFAGNIPKTFLYDGEGIVILFKRWLLAMVVSCVVRTWCLRVRVVFIRMRSRLEGVEDAACG